MPDGDRRPRRARRGRRGASTPSTAALYGYDFAGDASQQVEWVNLRVSGIGPITAPRDPPRPGRPRHGRPERPLRRTTRSSRPVCFEADDGYVDTPVLWRPDLRARRRSSTGPAIIEEYGSTVPLHPGFAARVDDYGNLS